MYSGLDVLGLSLFAIDHSLRFSKSLKIVQFGTQSFLKNFYFGAQSFLHGFHLIKHQQKPWSILVEEMDNTRISVTNDSTPPHP